ncbi:hypothetical protein [Acetobacter sp.]|uniref:hypothetical protein n=1 Tax=Acetobacter sp. TaxID=440 RepID=UPI0039ECE075
MSSDDVARKALEAERDLAHALAEKEGIKYVLRLAIREIPQARQQFLLAALEEICESEIRLPGTLEALQIFVQETSPAKSFQ